MSDLREDDATEGERGEADASDAERGEAEALARALDGQAGGRAPADALEVAALLRYARGGDQADDLRLQRVYGRLMRGRARGALFAGLLVAAAAFALVVLPVRRTAPPPAASREARADDLRALLDEQGRVLADPGRDLAELERLSAQHRRALLGRLGAHYGGGVP